MTDCHGQMYPRRSNTAHDSDSSARSRLSRVSNRYSMSILFSIVIENDVEVEDELAKAQRDLLDLKSKISSQSKDNFLLERNVRMLDSRIALLIQNRKAHDENHDFQHLDDPCESGGTHYLDDRKMQQYGNLLFLLQCEPKYIATLCRLVSLAEMDTLLQMVMFTLYGNQYDNREEHLLLTMFQNVLTTQFETTTEFASLLRANTPMSRMMTTYTRRGPGQSYLKSVLSDLINGLITRNEDLQINPEMVIMSRSASKVTTLDEDEVRAIRTVRTQRLIDIANLFLHTIVQSVDRVPYGIRWICKQIRSLTKRKYPDKSDEEIASMIGGFFFLRYVNPAIVTPQAYMLIDGSPERNSRVTLTSIAKLLQSLANQTTFSKENHMKEATEEFVKSNTDISIRFLNELCEVNDFYESLEMDQYMILTKKEIVISVTPNEIYNTIALLRQHIDNLDPSDTQQSHHLRLLIDEVGPVPLQIPRHENKPFELRLFGRWQIPIQDMKSSLMSENEINKNDILYMEVKSVFIHIIRSLSFIERPLKLMVIAEETMALKGNEALAEKGKRAKDMLDDLVDAGVVTPNDQFRFLVQEIEDELAHLGDVKQKVFEEFESLQTVYGIINDHNLFLKDQLKSYRAYLQNVRIQSGGKMESRSREQVGLGVEIANSKRNSAGTKIGRHPSRKPLKYTHHQLERDGVIVETEVPEYRRSNVLLAISSPTPGAYLISILYKGREKPIVEIDLKLDDLLEKQHEHVELLDLQYIKLNVNKTLQLLNKMFTNKKHSLFS